jgi:glycosyltransferase involved in cell wall biosynthesis
MLMNVGPRRAGRPGVRLDNALFVLVSFEGPDPYSQAGGLGVRVTGLTRSLTSLGFETHLFFVGDPDFAGEERIRDDRLVLHRWAQWISRYHPRGVYDGEADKVNDFTQSLPPYLFAHIIKPALDAGRTPILLFEEWQTAEAVTRLSAMLTAAGVRDRVLIAWNANHCYGFERINWTSLASAAMITTVSRHMRSIVRACGADARVIPNGLPPDALEPIPRQEVSAIRSKFAERPDAGVFFKMARWEREKGWTQALDAVSRLRDQERPLTLIARSGGPTGPGGELRREAAERGLYTASFDSEEAFLANVGETVRAKTDVVNLAFGVSPVLARKLYAASDGVLANSVSEPFGLVGLEAMAAGGVAYTGGTGEDYAVAGRNAVVLETLDPDEIVGRWNEMAASPETVARMRRSARKTALNYEWGAIAGLIIDVMGRQAERQGVAITTGDIEPRSPAATDEPEGAVD